MKVWGEVRSLLRHGGVGICVGEGEVERSLVGCCWGGGGGIRAFRGGIIGWREVELGGWIA